MDCISGTIIAESLVRSIHAADEMGTESQGLMIEKGHLCQLLHLPAGTGLFSKRKIWCIFSALSSLALYVNNKDCWL